MINKENIANIIKENSPVCVDSRCLKKLSASAEFLWEESQKYNLTALKTEEDIALLHYVDSLTLFDGALPLGKEIIDVGCGAGFPALVIAAYDETCHVTALDSTKKKTDFVALCAQKAGITNITPLCARAEELDKTRKFDIAVSRGVARLNVLTELCLPAVKVGGLFIAMKGDKGEEEAGEAMGAISICGGKLAEIRSVNIPKVQHRHTLIVIEKVKPTPDIYPRQYSKIIKKPLK